MTESEEELKSLLRKVKVESEKFDLKLNIQKTKIMAASNEIVTSGQRRRPLNLGENFLATEFSDSGLKYIHSMLFLF